MTTISHSHLLPDTSTFSPEGVFHIANHYSASPVRILYSSKAYLSPLTAQLMVEQGIGLDRFVYWSAERGLQKS